MFDSPEARQILSEIETEQLVPLFMVVKGILHYEAGEKYYSEDCWKDGGHLRVEDIKSMFNWKDGGRKLDDRECLQFYNDFLVPLWNYLIKENPRPLAFSCGDKIIAKKSELAKLMWLATKCQSVDGLNSGICPTPKKRVKG